MDCMRIQSVPRTATRQQRDTQYIARKKQDRGESLVLSRRRDVDVYCENREERGLRSMDERGFHPLFEMIVETLARETQARRSR